MPMNVPFRFSFTLLLAWLTTLLVTLFLWVSTAQIHALSGNLPPPSEAPLFSDPEQIARVSENSEGTYHRLLKYFQPASGQWCLDATDLTVIGAEPLALQRNFLPPRIAESYHSNKKWDLPLA